MDDFGAFFTRAIIDNITSVSILTLVALAVITDKLVWHKRLEKADARADRWEAIALEALTKGAEAGVRAAEVAVDAVSAIPDPSVGNGG